MLVEQWMSKPVITIDADDSMRSATGLMKENHIRMLPVMQKGKLVGVLTDRDLKRASASDATTLEIHELLYLISKIQVKQIMTHDLVTIPVDYTLDETAEILLKKKISGAPVLDQQGKLVGMITQTDIFKVLIMLTGIRKRGVNIGLRLTDQPGSIKEITDQIRQAGGRMASILTSYEDAPDGYRNVYLRFYGVALEKSMVLINDLKQRNLLLFMVDHARNKREKFGA